MFLIGGGAAGIVAVVGLFAGSPSTITSAALGIALVALGEGGWMLYTSKVAQAAGAGRRSSTGPNYGIPTRSSTSAADAACSSPRRRGVCRTGWLWASTCGAKRTSRATNPRRPRRTRCEKGVADRVEIKTGDARELPFGDEFFDAVVSTMTLHNIRDGRRTGEQAVGEMVRVLRPGGRIVIVDMGKTEEYAATLNDAGLLGVERGPRVWRMFPPVRYVTAAKS